MKSQKSNCIFLNIFWHPGSNNRTLEWSWENMISNRSFFYNFILAQSSEFFYLLFTGRWNEGSNLYACVNEDSWEIRRRHFRERYCNPQTERSRHKVRKDMIINFIPKTYLNSISYKESKALNNSSKKSSTKEIYYPGQSLCGQYAFHHPMNSSQIGERLLLVRFVIGKICIGISI